MTIHDGEKKLIETSAWPNSWILGLVTQEERQGVRDAGAWREGALGLAPLICNISQTVPCPQQPGEPRRPRRCHLLFSWYRHPHQHQAAQTAR